MNWLQKQNFIRDLRITQNISDWEIIMQKVREEVSRREQLNWTQW